MDSPTQSEGHTTSQVQDFELDPSVNEEEEEEVQGYKVPRVSFDSDDSGDELEKDALGRQRIRPKGNTFQDCNEDILDVINHNIHAHYRGPWISFSQVPDDVKELWWDEFRKHFFWRDRHAPRAKAVWRSKCSQHIRNVMWDHRASGKKPGFLSPENWADMLDQWRNDEKYKNSSVRNKRSRASQGRRGTSRYAGGSRSVVQNVDKTEKEIGRRMTQDELMTMMYHSKKQGKWMGDRPQKDMDCFNKLCTEWKASHPGEEMSQELINKFWLIASGGECNGRISGQGSLYRKMDNVLNPAAHAPSVQSSPTSFLPPQVGSPPAPTPPLPRLVSPTPRVASPSRYESSIEARIQQQDELIVQLTQQLHQERQQRLDTNRPHVIMPSTTTSSSNMSFQTIPSSNMSFQAIPSSNLAFQPIPSSNLMIPTMPSSNLSFQAMPSSNMSYQAMLQSTEPSAYQDMSAGMFGPTAGPSAGPTVGPSAGPTVGVGSQFYGDGNARRN